MEQETNLSRVLVSLLYFVLGIVLIAATAEVITTFNYILVSICAIIGVLQIISFLISKKYKENDYSDLLIAVVFLWVSLILYVYYTIMINLLPILFSLYLFVMAVDMISKYTITKNKQHLILSILAVIVGLLLIFNPGSIIITYLKVTGVYLVIVSILNFKDLLRKKKNNK